MDCEIRRGSSQTEASKLSLVVINYVLRHVFEPCLLKTVLGRHGLSTELKHSYANDPELSRIVK